MTEPRHIQGIARGAVPGGDGRLDRWREQHRHVRGLARAPCLNEFYRILNDLWPQCTARSRSPAAIKANFGFHHGAMCSIACATKSAKAKRTRVTTSSREANESQGDRDAESDEPRQQLEPIFLSTNGPYLPVPGNRSGHGPPRVRRPKERE
jgi:hypothetical protein